MAAVLFVCSFAGVLVANQQNTAAEMAAAGASTREELERHRAEQRERAQEEEAAKAEASDAARREAEAQRQLSEKKKAADDYIETLRREMDGMSDFSPRDYADSIDSLTIALALPQAWANIYEEGHTLELTPEQEAVRQQFRKAISRRQTEILPVLRDLYGPAMRKQLWEADGKAKTFSAGFRTVEFISAAFAANRNIKEIHQQMHPTLLMFRFTRAQYKWVDANVEYSYYTLEPPKDGDVGIWSGNGRFRPVE